MATNKIQLKVDLYKVTNEDSKLYGKYLGRAVRQSTLTTRGLAEHIAGHGTIYTQDIVDGVLRKLSQCIPELISQGVAVKIDGLGTFFPTLENTKGGANSVQDYNLAQNVKGIHVRFQPDGVALDNITSKAFLLKCQLEKRYLVTYTGKGKLRKATYTPIGDLEQPVSNDGGGTGGGE